MVKAGNISIPVILLLVAGLTTQTQAQFIGSYQDTSGNIRTLFTTDGNLYPFLNLFPIVGDTIEPGEDLTGVNLTNADLTEADLRGTNLTNAILFGAVLIDAYMTDARLENTDLRAANCTGVKSGGITGSPFALATDFRLADGYLVGPGANLIGAKLNGTDLSNSNLTWANTYEAEFTNVNFSYSTFVNVIAYEAVFDGCDFTGATVIASGRVHPGAGLSGSIWIGVNFRDADLSGAGLHNITLSHAKSGGTIPPLHDTWLPGGWSAIEGGFLVGPTADLSGEDLSGLDLSGVSFVDVDLTGANLGGSNLVNTNFTGASLDGVVLTGAYGNPLVDRINAAESQLANAYTLSEIADLRPGSVMIEVVDGEATMHFPLKVSTDLQEWFPAGESSAVTVPVPDSGVKFFRFVWR